MFDSLGIETYSAPQISLILALVLGSVFGILAEQTKFCFRRSLIGPDRKQAAGLWAIALGVAIFGTQLAVYFDLISFADHRFMAANAPILAAVVGGLMFGCGMVLSRGCASRLTVLSGTGNMRALVTLVIFGLVANATMKGPLADLRVGLTSYTVDLGTFTGISSRWVVAVLIITLLAFGLTARNRPSAVIMAVAIGSLPAMAWVATGYVLYDDFDPITFESLAFTGPTADSVFWIVASTSLSAKFSLGLLAGVIAGAFVSAAGSKRLEWVGFDGPAQMGRYAAAAAFMGFGGVIAGGCTIGAGLSGIPTLSIAAIVTLLSIAAGVILTHAALGFIPFSREYAESKPTQALQPAE